MDDVEFERKLQAKAVRFGVVLLILGVGLILFSYIDPIGQAHPDFYESMGWWGEAGNWHGYIIAAALVVEGLRRVVMAKAPEESLLDFEP